MKETKPPASSRSISLLYAMDALLAVLFAVAAVQSKWDLAGAAIIAVMVIRYVRTSIKK